MLGRVLSLFTTRITASLSVAAVGVAGATAATALGASNDSTANAPTSTENSKVGEHPWPCSSTEYPVRVYRHGEHYDFYGPDKDFSKTMGGSCYFGQLTDLGHQQMREIGSKLRERYVESEDTRLFAPSVDPSSMLQDIYVRSTDSRRTVETVYELLRGLMNVKAPSFSKRPIEINVVDAEDEIMYPRGSCEALKIHFRDAKQDAQFVKAKQEAFGMMDFTKMTLEEEKYWKSRALPALCNTLSSMSAHKFPLPGGLKEEQVADICDRSAIEYATFYGSQMACRLGIGRFLRTLKRGIEEKIKQEENVLRQEDVIGVTHNVHVPKMRFYSGHDNTLGPMLLSLGVFDSKHPPMGSTIILELWKQSRNNGDKELDVALSGSVLDGVTSGTGSRSNDYFVKILYNFKEVALPGCDNQVLCPVDKFEKLLEPLIPKDYHAECMQTKL